MKCTTFDGKSIYYEVQGNINSSKTIIFLNGLSQSTVSWGLLTPYFFKDYKIILMDFIFQGQSDKEGEVRDFDTHAKDVLTVMDTLEIQKISIVGLSYGSLVGQHFALLYPERLQNLILLSTFAHKTPYYEAIELSWRRSLDQGGYSLMLDVMMPFVLSDTYFNNPLIPIDLLKQSRQDLIEAKSLTKLMQATADRKDYRPFLKQVNTPTLVIHGQLDNLFHVDLGKAVADAIPNATFIIIQNAGHTLNLEATSIVAQHIINFIEEKK